MDIISAAVDGAEIALDAANGDHIDALRATTVFAALNIYRWSSESGAENPVDPEAAKALVSVGFAMLTAAVLQGADLASYMAELLVQTEESTGADYVDDETRQAVYKVRDIEARSAVLAQLSEALTRRAA